MILEGLKIFFKEIFLTIIDEICKIIRKMRGDDDRE
jgi:hypothetical protein